MRKILSFLFVLFSLSIFSDQYRYRVYFTDKPDTRAYEPEAVLSKKTIEKRRKYKLMIDERDFPVCDSYLNTLSADGYNIICKSKWMNTAVVGSDIEVISKLRRYEFVQDVKLVWYTGPVTKAEEADEDSETPNLSNSFSVSEKFQQLRMHNLDKLHESGYNGKGLTIAILDAGFCNADKIDMINSNVIGVKDMVVPALPDFYRSDSHGTNVLSILSYKNDGEFSGSAPGAEYILIRTEDVKTEFPIEEDYWVAGAEYADSIGADIITSSLGYFQFDDSSMNYKHADLDGNTAFISKGAGVAAEKGILVVNSAGNEGHKHWRRINFPADCPNIITVGSVNADSTYSFFSGKGYMRDGIVKPDITSLGNGTWLCDSGGELIQSLGTSYSTPIITGLAASIWEAFPYLSSSELKQMLIEHSSRYETPDSLMGYGIPNGYKLIATLTGEAQISESLNIVEYSYKGENIWSVKIRENIAMNFPVFVVSTSGQVLIREQMFCGDNELSLDSLSPGFYVINVLVSEQKYPKLVRVE